MNREKSTNIRDQRASFAFKAANSWGESWRDKALAAVKSIPVAIRTQGLAQTLATLMRGAKSHEKELAFIVADWLLNKAPRKTLSPGSDKSQKQNPPRLLLEACIKADRTSYLAAQAEAIALMDMVKLYAQALHEGE